MSTWLPDHARGLATAFAAALLCACAIRSGPLKPFATDGCSLFPDRAPIGASDWCRCCVAHDLAYWRGGTAEQRIAADRRLEACIADASGDRALAGLMYAAVRAGGGPWFFTPYRWGYGWPYRRPYGPLAPQEQAAAAQLENEYRTRNPTLSCLDHAAAE